MDKKSAGLDLPEKVSSLEIIKAEDKAPEKPGKKPFLILTIEKIIRLFPERRGGRRYQRG